MQENISHFAIQIKIIMHTYTVLWLTILYSGYMYMRDIRRPTKERARNETEELHCCTLGSDFFIFTWAFYFFSSFFVSSIHTVIDSGFGLFLAFQTKIIKCYWFLQTILNILLKKFVFFFVIRHRCILVIFLILLLLDTGA